MASGKKDEPRVQRIKMGGGGAWKGALWFPHEPTAEAIAKAAEFGNSIVDDETVTGDLYRGKAFGDKEIFYLKRPVSDEDLALPEHVSLGRDLSDVVERYGDGQLIEVSYKGSVEVKKGKYKGKQAHVYDVYALVKDADS